MLLRPLAVAALLVALAVNCIPRGAHAAAADFAIPRGHFYTQASGSNGPNGFALVDDSAAPFWRWFQKLGGVDALGYPNTNRFILDGYLVQGTQRAVLQWHPDTKTMAFMNVMDYIHSHGLDSALQATYQIPPPADDSQVEAGLTFAQVANLRTAWLSPSPALKRFYLADPYRIDHDGLPTSQLVDDGPFTVVRMRRAAFQLWNEAGPSGIQAGQITQVLGSDLAKKLNLFTRGAITPGPATGGPLAEDLPSVQIPAALTGYQYGFTVEMQQGHAKQIIDLTKQAGFTWIKQQIRWQDVESQPGQLDWTYPDKVADIASAWGVNVLFSVTGAPSWASVPGADFPADPTQFASFMAQMAAHFKGRVKAYEIWNEENYATEVGAGNINPGAYVELLKAAYPAIKSNDPSALVVSGAPTPTGINNPNVAMDDLDYLRQMYVYQGGIVRNYYDALGAHPEGFGNAPEETVARHAQPGFSNDPSFFVQRAQQYRDLMMSVGEGSKPVWLTDIGYGSNSLAPPAYAYENTINEQRQADYLTREIYYIRAHWPWVGAMFIWNLNFQSFVPQTDEKWGFSVLRADYSPRPAYLALKDMPK